MGSSRLPPFHALLLHGVLLFASSLAGLLVATQSALAAPALVRFGATVVSSPFASGELANGATITGRYALDTSMPASSSGRDFAEYALSGASLFAGASAWSTDVARTFVADSIFASFGDGTAFPSADLYMPTFYALRGPSVEGHHVLFGQIALVDPDAVLYEGEMPIVPPALDDVALATLTIGVSVRPGVDSAYVTARVDALQVLHAEGELSGSGGIDAPPGALALNVPVAGTAKFKLDVRYRKHASAPDGDFQLKAAAGVRIDCGAIDTLVTGGGYAYVAGACVLNDNPAYGAFRFAAAAVDGKVAKSGPDRLRVLVWDGAGSVFYDSLPGRASLDETVPIADGSIVVKTK